MPWVPDFSIYHRWDGSSPTVVTVDGNASAGAAAKSHVVYCVVEIPIEKPDERGLPTSRERPAIDAIEDAVTAHLEREFDAWFVGRATGDGTVSIFLYLAHEQLRGRGLFSSGPIDRDPGLLGTVRTPAGAAIQHTIGVDPDWRMYAEFLAPSPLQLLMSQAAHVGLELDGHGDQADVPRAIDHVATFPDAAAAHAAASALVGAAFAIVNIAPDPGGDGSQRVEFTRVDSRGAVEIEQVLTDVLSCIEPHGGVYDGWGCPVTTDPGASGTGRRGLLGRLRRAA